MTLKSLLANVAIRQTGLDQWIDISRLEPDDSMADRCTPSFLQSAVAHLEGVTIIEARLNRSGSFTPPQTRSHILPISARFDNLPDFCQILVRKKMDGGHHAEIHIWVPMAWNGRFAATGGQGSLTGPLWMDDPALRALTLPVAIRNGFATAATDAGNRSTRIYEWGLDEGDGKLDWNLIRGWAHEATHDMAVTAKAVITGLAGQAPLYSYYVAGSGGGRQGMASLQRHPRDFDGLLLGDPAVRWTRMCPSTLWPSLVMKWNDTPLPRAKLDAFRDAALEKLDGADGLRDGFYGWFEPDDFDTATMIGVETAAGPITAMDAIAMREIWGGARRVNGEAIWHGMRPGADCWTGGGIMSTLEVDGKAVPAGNIFGATYFAWVTENPDFDWTTLTPDMFETLVDRGIEKFGLDLDGDTPNIETFALQGGKLLITQAVNDQIIHYRGAVDYYERIAERAGGLEQARAFARLFLTDGDTHGFCVASGPGIPLSQSVAALMRWVEQGEAPERLIGARFDRDVGKVLAERPVYAYPAATRYRGDGDPDEVSSYESVPPEQGADGAGRSARVQRDASR